jgi:predicted secreted hydrolase
MDHEYSTSALTEDQIGWDWFSLQFEGGSDLMLFQLRLSDGGVDPFSSGSFIDTSGNVTNLSVDDFRITVQETWESTDTGARYPAKWLLEVPTKGIELIITPLMADQELNVTYSYWEGAVQFSGTREGVQDQGYGYVELTGY